MDRALVACKDTNAIASQDIPHADGPISRARGHVVGIRMEAGTGDVSQVAGKHAKRLVMVCCPETSYSVMTPGDKIVSVGGKLGVPHRVVVAFVAH